MSLNVNIVSVALSYLLVLLVSITVSHVIAIVMIVVIIVSVVVDEHQLLSLLVFLLSCAYLLVRLLLHYLLFGCRCLSVVVGLCFCLFVHLQ